MSMQRKRGPRSGEPQRSHMELLTYQTSGELSESAIYQALKSDQLTTIHILQYHIVEVKSALLCFYLSNECLDLRIQ